MICFILIDFIVNKFENITGQIKLNVEIPMHYVETLIFHGFTINVALKILLVVIHHSYHNQGKNY